MVMPRRRRRRETPRTRGPSMTCRDLARGHSPKLHHTLWVCGFGCSFCRWAFLVRLGTWVKDPSARLAHTFGIPLMCPEKDAWIQISCHHHRLLAAGWPKVLHVTSPRDLFGRTLMLDVHVGSICGLRIKESFICSVQALQPKQVCSQPPTAER